MRIVYLHQYFITPKQAGATRSYEMARRLVEYGHEVHMVTSDAGWMDRNQQKVHSGWYITEESGIHVHWYPVKYSNHMSFNRRIRAFIQFMHAATGKARELGGDVIYASSSPLTIAIPGVRASKRNRVPMCFEVRDLWPEAPIQMGALKNPVLRWMARRLEVYAYRNAAHVVGLSPGMRDGIVAAGKAPEAVSVIPNSSDLKNFHPGVDGSTLRERLGLRDKFVLAYCGTMGMANGLGFVLDAAAELKRRGNDRVVFLMVGDGKERPMLEARVHNEGLSNVVFHEPVKKDAMPEIVAACDVAMTIFKNVPILRTCSPNKMFDALAAGKPVLTNMPGWLGDIAEKQETGVLVAPDNAIDFADKAMWMSENPARLKVFAANARKVAESEFSRDVLARRLEKVLLDAVAQYSR